MESKTGIEPLNGVPQSLVDRVSHAVRGAILEGRLRPGEGLSISDLAADLGVSQSPVREALQRLSGEGLVVLRPARTAIVAPLELDDLKEIYRLRGLLEVDAVARSASKFAEADIAVLTNELEAMTQADPNTDEFWARHSAFHTALMKPVLSPRLERMINELWGAGQRYIRIVYLETDALRTRSPRERHEPLLDAAVLGDTRTLRKALAEHLQMNEREIVKALETVMADARLA
jgi:DNA-binding GntR family transcriptional regulator